MEKMCSPSPLVPSSLLPTSLLGSSPPGSHALLQPGGERNRPLFQPSVHHKRAVSLWVTLVYIHTQYSWLNNMAF